MNIIISNQKLDLTVVVGEVLQFALVPFMTLILSFGFQAISLTLNRFCICLTLRNQWLQEQLVLLVHNILNTI